MSVHWLSHAIQEERDCLEDKMPRTENWPSQFMGLAMAIEMEEDICWRNMS